MNNLIFVNDYIHNAYPNGLPDYLILVWFEEIQGYGFLHVESDLFTEVVYRVIDDFESQMMNIKVM